MKEQKHTCGLFGVICKLHHRHLLIGVIVVVLLLTVTH